MRAQWPRRWKALRSHKSPARCLLCSRRAVLLAPTVVILVPVNIALVLSGIFQSVVAANGYMGHGTRELCKHRFWCWRFGDFNWPGRMGTQVGRTRFSSLYIWSLRKPLRSGLFLFLIQVIGKQHLLSVIHKMYC